MKEKKKKFNKKVLILLVFCIVSIVTLVSGIHDLYVYTNLPENVDYNTFMEYVNKNEIHHMKYLNSNEYLYSLNDEKISFLNLDKTNRLSVKLTDETIDILQSHNVKIDDNITYIFLEVIKFELNAFIMIIVILLYRYMLPMMVGIVSSNVCKEIEKDTNISFEDIIGHDEILLDIKDVLDVMKNGSKYYNMDVRIPKGLLLIGPPGTGKTMIAKALAKEANCSFYRVNCSAIIDKYVGQGSSNIRNIFKMAKKNAPCVLFFDEIDAIGGNRSNMEMTEYKQTLNELLTQMDGFDTKSGVYLIAATNNYEALDSALTRTGRFDRIVQINPPKDVKTRSLMLQHYLGDGAKYIDCDYLAKQMTGLTGSDISVLVNEAKLIAIRNNDSKLNINYLEEALDKLIMHGNRTRTEYDNDMKIVSIHETGHALSFYINNINISRISIIPNTSGVGGMVVGEEIESNLFTKDYIRKQIKSLYAGRIAEALLLGEDNITIGASNDFEKATQLIHDYIGKYNFVDNLGKIVYMKEDKLNSQNYEELCINLSNQLYSESYQELKSNILILENLSKIVYEKETMDGSEFKHLVENCMCKIKEEENEV